MRDLRNIAGQGPGFPRCDEVKCSAANHAADPCRKVGEIIGVKLIKERLAPPKTYREAIEWLLNQHAIPVWDPTNTKGNVHFRRLSLKKEKEMLRKQYRGMKIYPPSNIATEEDRLLIVELLGIKSAKGCAEIKKMLYDLGLRSE